jgi:hypothetical protein
LLAKPAASWLLAAALVIGGGLLTPSIASATPTVAFTPAFSGGDLGEAAGVTVTFDFTGNEYSGSPLPLTKLILHLPSGVGGSSAGFPTCEVTTLEEFGPINCPAGSSTGPTTSATAYVSFGGERVEEQAEVLGFYGADETVNFFVDGHSPVSLEILAHGTVRADSAPYGRLLELTVPLVASVPGAPFASIKTLALDYGAVHDDGFGEPASVTIPRECPTGRFEWGMEAGFSDGTNAVASSISPCPPAALPVAAQRQAVNVTAGTVTVRLPGSTTFVPLSGEATIPNGSELDTTEGTVSVTAATATPGKTESAEVHGGQLIVRQDATRAAATHFILSLPLTGCLGAERRDGRAAAASTPVHHGPRSRRLWVSEHGGNWGTDGRYVSTTVEGTSWLTTDECGRSEVEVLAGRVRVHDLIRNKTKTVVAGQHYIAVAKRH